MKMGKMRPCHDPVLAWSSDTSWCHRILETEIPRESLMETQVFRFSVDNIEKMVPMVKT